MSIGLILVILLVIFLLGGFSGRFGGYGYGSVTAVWGSSASSWLSSWCCFSWAGFDPTAGSKGAANLG